MRVCNALTSTHSSSVHVPSWNTQTTFQSSDKRLKVFELPKNLLCIYGQHPKSASTRKAGCYFLCGDFKKKKGKKSEGDIWTEVSLWKITPCQLAEGAGMSWNWRAGVDWTALLILLFISLAFFGLISIAILHWRAPFAAVHTSCDLYSK